MANSPLAQFIIKPLIKLEIFGFDISFTNLSLIMVIATGLIIFLLSFISNNKTVPSKMHLLNEAAYNVIGGVLENNIGKEGKKFTPLLFCIFLFILFCNLLGLVPYSYAATSQIIVTFFIAIIIFIVVVVTGFIKQGSHFLRIFLPGGTPLWLAPLLIIIELFAFLARPVSLSLRLAANIIAGHILTKVIAGFCVMLPIYFKFVPLPLLVIIMGFEFFVAILQAYIFAVLSSVYLKDALQGH